MPATLPRIVSSSHRTLSLVVLFKRPMIPFFAKKFLSRLRHPQPKGEGYISWHARVEGEGQRNISVGAHSYIARDAWLHSRTKNCSITIGKYSSVNPYTKLVTEHGGSIKIGDHCKVDSFSVLYGSPGGLVIGNHVRMAVNVTIVTSNHKFGEPGQIYGQGQITKGVTIGDDVWIGAGVIILDGVTIGSHSVIGAGSVVTKDVPENSVALGVPAAVVKTRVAE